MVSDAPEQLQAATRMPDFYIIGAPKCGTTTLYDWLGGHPKIYAPHKEPCFFSQDIYPTVALPTHIRSLEEYTGIFSTNLPSQAISGEATPKYLYSDMALSELSRLRPDARIIVCLRDPVDLVLSFHSQKFREGEESEADFVKAWRRVVAPGGLVKSRAPTVEGQINYVFWGAFGERIALLHKGFPAEQILLLTLSEIKTTPARTYAKVLEFLGVENDNRTEFVRSNVGYRIKYPGLYKAIMRTKRFAAPVIRSLQKFRGDRGLGMMKWLNRWITEPGRYDIEVPDSIRCEIRQVLAADTCVAETFLGKRDLVENNDINKV